MILLRNMNVILLTFPFNFKIRQQKVSQSPVKDLKVYHGDWTLALVLHVFRRQSALPNFAEHANHYHYIIQ